MSADTTRSGDALALAEADRPSDDIDFKDVRLSARRSSASGNPDTREIGAPLLSLRDGKDHVIWVVELDEPAAGVKITWTPIEPTLPSIDFGDLGEDSGASGER